MKALEQIYKVELNKDEIITLTDALDSLLEVNKIAYEDADNDKREKDADFYLSQCTRFCTLRNQFANLIGRTFKD